MASEPRSGNGQFDPRNGLSVSNGGQRRERVRVVQIRGRMVREAYRTLEPGEAASLRVPNGSGPVRVELYTPDAVATTSFDPEHGSAFLDVCDGSVLVGRL